MKCSRLPRLVCIYEGITKLFSLTISQATVQALFSDDILNKFYGVDGFFGPICEAATKSFDQTITAFARSGKKVLRVLEVGAGKIIYLGLRENRKSAI